MPIQVEKLAAVPSFAGGKAMSLKQHFRAFLRGNGVKFEGTWRPGAVFPQLDNANREHQAIATAVAMRFFRLHHGYSALWKAETSSTRLKRNPAKGVPKHYAVKLTLKYG